MKPHFQSKDHLLKRGPRLKGGMEKNKAKKEVGEKKLKKSQHCKNGTRTIGKYI